MTAEQQAEGARAAHCEQNCGAPATVYAIDPIPGGWGGRYCESCATALRFAITDRLVAGR